MAQRQIARQVCGDECELESAGKEAEREQPVAAMSRGLCERIA